MIRTVNLFSLASIQNSEAEQGCIKYLSTAFKYDEIITLQSFCDTLRKAGVRAFDVNDFYIGFHIPQISKEFDLLRISDNIVIDIEIKTQYTDKILQQLKRNKYYLRFLQKDLYLFSYCARENRIYILDPQENLKETNVEFLISVLRSQENYFRKDLSSLFNPSDFLVSPFNSIDRFLNGEYFLTSQQEEISKAAKDAFNRKAYLIFSIKGNAGTGKSLLLYHIAKEFRENTKNILIIHGGNLNRGQNELRQQGWEIESIKSILPLFDTKTMISQISANGIVETVRKHPQAGIAKYSVLLIDEAQRITEHQFRCLIEYARINNILCVFSHDETQTLRSSENFTRISAALEKHAHFKFELTEKIRTNKEIADFIYTILGKKHEKINITHNASVVFFKTIEDAADYILSKTSNGWAYITHTPSIDKYRERNQFDRLLYLNEVGTAHAVIGQEFDDVIAVIDSSFRYDEDGILTSYGLPNNPYLRQNMFFQAITRVRQKLEIVIVDNIEVYNKMLSFFY